MWYDVLHSTHSREAWRWAALRVSLSTYPDQKFLLSGSRKAGVVPVIRIDDCTKTMVESILETVGRKSQVDICLSRIPGTIEAVLLSQAVSKVEKCRIWCGKAGQLEAILSALSEGQDITLKSLSFYGMVVARVSPDILGRAAVKLVKLDLPRHTSAQIGEILTRLASTKGSKLSKFHLSSYGGEKDLSHLSPAIVTAALMKLETTGAILQHVRLSPDQIKDLITKMSGTEDLKFTWLHLADVNILQAAPDVVAGAVTRLVSVTMVDVSPAQLRSLFTRIQFGGSRLKKLSLSRVDLSALNLEDLLGAIRMLERVTFVGAAFTTAQVSAIVNMVIQRSQGKLVKLEIISPNVEGEAFDLLKAAEPNDILEIEF